MVSLELLTVLVVAPLACLVCYDIAKKNPRANILMIIIATAELYGGTSLWSRLRSPEAIQMRARGEGGFPVHKEGKTTGRRSNAISR